MSWDNKTGWWVAGLPYVIEIGPKRERKYIIGSNAKMKTLLSDTHLQLHSCGLDGLVPYFRYYQDIPPVLKEKGEMVCVNGIPAIIVENEAVHLTDASFFERVRENIRKDLLVKNAVMEPIFSEDGMHPSVLISAKKEEEKFFETSKYLEGSGLLSTIARKYNALIEKHGKTNVWSEIAMGAMGAGMIGKVALGTVAVGTPTAGAFIIGYIIVAMLPTIIYMAADIMRLLHSKVWTPVINLIKLAVLPLLAIANALTEIMDAYRNGKTVASGVWNAMKEALSQLKSAFMNIFPLIMKFSQNLSMLSNIKNMFYASGQPLGPIYTGNIKEFWTRLKSVGSGAKTLATNFTETVTSIGSFLLKTPVMACMGFRWGAAAIIRKCVDKLSGIPGLRPVFSTFLNGLNNLEKGYRDDIVKQSKEILQIYPAVKSVLDWTNFLIMSPFSLFLLSQSIFYFFGGWLPLSIVAILGMIQTQAMGVAGIFFILLVIQKCTSTIWNYMMYYACIKEHCGQNDEPSYQDLGTSVCMSDCWNAGTEGLSSLHLPPGVLGQLNELDYGMLSPYKSTIVTFADGLNSYQTGTMEHFLTGQFRVNIYDTYAKAAVERAYEQHARQRIDSALFYAEDIAKSRRDAFLTSAYDLGCTVIKAPSDGWTWVLDKSGNITYSIRDNAPSFSFDFIKKVIWPEWYIDGGSGETIIATPEQMKEIEDAMDKTLRRTRDELKVLLVNEGEIIGNAMQSFWDAIRKDNSKKIYGASTSQYLRNFGPIMMDEAKKMSQTPAPPSAIIPTPQATDTTYMNIIGESYFDQTSNITGATPAFNLDLDSPQLYTDLPEPVQDELRSLFYQAYNMHLEEMTTILKSKNIVINQSEETMKLVADIMTDYDAFEKKREAEDQQRRDASKAVGENMYKNLMDLAEQEDYNKKGRVSKIYSHPSLVPTASPDVKESIEPAKAGWFEYLSSFWRSEPAAKEKTFGPPKKLIKRPRRNVPTVNGTAPIVFTDNEDDSLKPGEVSSRENKKPPTGFDVNPVVKHVEEEINLNVVVPPPLINSTNTEQNINTEQKDPDLLSGESCIDITKIIPQDHKEKVFNTVFSQIEFGMDQQAPSALRWDLITMWGSDKLRENIPESYRRIAELLYNNRDCSPGILRK